jgi:RND family efflux transporter MFP subunit
VNVTAGSKVSAGQVLISLDASALNSQLSELRTALSLAETTYERQKKLWDQKIGTEMQFLQAKNRVEDLKQKVETLQANIRKFSITAPFNGTVDDVYSTIGQLASPGVPLLRLVNEDANVIKGQASERFVGKLKVGDKVKVNYPALGLTAIERIHTIGQNIDAGNRTFNIFIHPDNHKGKLKPNLLAIITAAEFQESDIIAVPTKLVRLEGDERFVFVAVKQKDGSYLAEKRKIEIERSFIDRTIVANGLLPGDLIIRDGFQSVTTGDILNIRS